LFTSKVRKMDEIDMMKEILLLGIGFFAFMTVYNLIVAIRRKEGFTPNDRGIFDDFGNVVYLL